MSATTWNGFDEQVTTSSGAALTMSGNLRIKTLLAVAKRDKSGAM